MILREAIEKRTFFLVAAISFIVGALAYEPPKSSLVRISSYCGIAVCVFAIVSEGLGRGYGSGWLLYQNRFGESLRRSGTSEQQLAHVEIIGPKKLSPRVLPLQICHSQECTDTTQHREIPVYKLWSNEHSGLPLFISALKVNDDIFSRDSNRMISAWHGDCVEYHAGCSKELPDQMPTRLIDIEQMCVVTEVGTAPYVFLSWNWSQDASSMLTTTSKLPQYENSGIKAFPAAIAGAIRLARELGYSYVWADLYCVVHDDLEDKNIELSKITSYVEQATLTIGVTLGAFDKRINTSKTSEPIPYALAVKSGRGSFQDINGNIFVSTPLPDATSSLLSSQWASRGWTLQERYYSSRTLVIGEDRLYWNCNTLLRSETSLEAHPPLWRLRRCGDVKSFSSGIADRSVWYSLVEYHSATSITTYVRDKLASVSALAGSLAGGDTYCMGHWSNDAPTGLLWRTWTDQKRDSEWLGMPSWSWGSAAGPVTFIAVRCSRVPTLNDASIEFCGAGPAIPHSYDPSREDLTMRLRARTRSLLLSDHPNVRFDAADTPRPKNGNVVLQNSLLIVYLAKYRSKTRNVQRWYGLALRKVSFEALDKEEQNTLQSPNCAPTPEYYKRIGLYLGPAEQITATPDEQKMSNSGVWGEWQDLLVI